MRIADAYSSGKNKLSIGKEGICTIDGAVEGNPGRGGIGVILEEKKGGKTTFIVSKGVVGNITNNEAEWLALLEALRLAKRKGFSKLEVITDSQLLFKQWEGSYKVRAPHLRKLYERAKNLGRVFEELKIVKASRKETKEAHLLANKAIEKGERK